MPVFPVLPPAAVRLSSLPTAVTVARSASPSPAPGAVSEVRRVQLLAQYAAMPAEGVAPAARNLYPVFQKLRHGKAVTVAYFGGSITWGGASSDVERFSYRARVSQWLAARFPKAKIKSIDSALGGTGSNLGAFRTAAHVLNFRPDIVFVEFTVNDNGTPTTRESNEGVLRQLLAHGIAPVLIISAMRSKDLPREYVWELARHYDLPVINVMDFVHDRMAAGDFTWSDYAGDDVHPNNWGHTIMAERITAWLEAQIAVTTRKRKAKPVPAPLTANRFQNVRLEKPGEVRVINGWRVETPAFGPWQGTIPAHPPADDAEWPHPFQDGFLRADEVGAAFETSFDGPLIGLHADYGKGCGTLKVEVDGKLVQRLELNPEWAGSRIPVGVWVWPNTWGAGRHVMRVTLDAVPDVPAPLLGRARVGYVLKAEKPDGSTEETSNLRATGQKSKQ